MLQAAKNPNDIGRAIERIQQEAKTKAKELALTHHPDHGGDEERMKEINAAVTAVQRKEHYRLLVPRPQPMIRVIHVQSSWTTSSSTTTNTSYTTTGWTRI
jgi:hypothetical protein